MELTAQQLSDAECAALARTPYLTNLRVLRLDRTEAAGLLADTLRGRGVLPQLHELYLVKCRFGDTAAAWLAAALLIPVSLAIGNVFRTLAWPADSTPLALAVGSNLAAAGMLLLLAFANGETQSSLLLVPWLMLAQAVASSAMFLFFFRLQRVGGPVTLSQIGTVAAAVGIGVGAGLLGERYAAVVWSGVAVIAVGLALTMAARRHPEPSS